MEDLGEFGQFLLKIQQQYPAALAILSQPGVMAVYKQAIDGPDAPWSVDRIQAALEQTQWWQTTDKSTREWQALRATDPVTANETIADTRRTIENLETQLGVQLSNSGGLGAQSLDFLQQAVTQGWDANRIKYELISWTYGGLGAKGGEVGANAAQVGKKASDYGVPLSTAATMKYAGQIASGAIDLNAVQGYMIEQAKSLFPSLTHALDSGITVRQYVDPYVQIAQNEVGINPSDVNLTDQKWLNLLNQVDPKTGARTSMSLDQALKTIRTDPVWGYDTTHKAGQDASQLASQLEQKFGAA